MMSALSWSLSFAQPAISGRVRRQPRQKPVTPSTAQTFTQGVTIGLGGRGRLVSVFITAIFRVRLQGRKSGYVAGRSSHQARASLSPRP